MNRTILIALVLAGVLLLGCADQTDAERAAEQAQIEKQRAELDVKFPAHMVVCDVETGKAYVANRYAWDGETTKYRVEEFPLKAWKCAFNGNQEKAP